jgi:ABC-type phosphate transport system substrate-binding protein
MMVMRALVALMAVSGNLVSGEKPVLSIHGSGTTNPSKCFWHVMDKMEARAKLPMHMTYRGIGSSDGQAEFNTNPPVTYFGSGDIPLKQELYDYLSATEVIFQLPVFVGAVSIFHSVPSTPTLNMTACTLAKIMKRDITEWDHPEIKSSNPELSVPSGGLAIRVARRTDGASSTSGISAVSSRSLEWSMDDGLAIFGI